MLLLLVLPLLAWSSRAWWLTPLVRARLMAELSTALAAPVACDALRGPDADGLVLTGLHTTAPGGAIERLTVTRLRVSWRWWPLLTGGLDGITAIQADGVELVLRDDSGPPGPATPFALPVRLPPLALSGTVSLPLTVPVLGRDLGLSATLADGAGVLSWRLPRTAGSTTLAFAAGVLRSGPLRLPGLTVHEVVLGPGSAGPDLDATGTIAASAVTVALRAGALAATAAHLNLQRLPAPWQVPGLRGTADASVTLDAHGTWSATAAVQSPGWFLLGLDSAVVTVRSASAGTLVAGLSLAAPGLSVDLRDTVLEPASPWPLQRVGSIALEVEDLGPWLALAGLRVMPPDAVAVSLRGHDEAGWLQLDRAELRCGGSHLSLGGRLQPRPDGALALHADGLLALDDWREDSHGAITVQLTANGALSMPELAGTLSATAVTLAGIPVDSVAAGWSGTPPHWTLRQAALTRGPLVGLLSASLDLESDLAMADLLVTADDVGAVLAGVPGADDLDGRMAVRLVAEAIPLAQPSAARVQASAELLGLAWQGRALGGVSASAAAQDGRWTVAMTGSATGAATARLGPAAGQVDVTALQFGPMRLAQPASVSWAADGWTVQNVAWRLGTGLLTITAAGGRTVAIQATGQDLPLPGGVGRAQCSLAITGPAARPQMLFTASSAGTWRGQDWHGELLASQAADGLALHRLVASVGDGGALSATGRWPVVLGSTGLLSVPGPVGVVSATATAVAKPWWFPAHWPVIPVSGSALATAELTPRGVRLVARADELLLPAQVIPPEELDAGTTPAHDQALSATMAMTVDRSGARVDGEAWGDRGGRLLVSGAINAAGAWPLSGSATLADMDLTSMASLLSGLRRLGGTANGTLLIGGTVAAPTLTGELAVAGVEVKTRTVLAPLTQGTGTVRWLANRVVSADFTGALGGAPLHLLGTVDLSGAVPQVDLTLSGRRLLLLQDQYLRLRASTGAAGLHLAGPLDALVLSGMVTVDQALWSRPVGFGVRGGGGDQGVLFSITEPPLDALRFAVTVRATDTLRLRNNLLDVVGGAALQLGGTGSAPELTGQVWSTRGRVRLPFAALTLERSTVTFPADAPLAAELDAEAASSIAGRAVRIWARGTLPNVTIEASADGLSPSEAMQLVTTGRVPGSDGEGASGNVLMVGTFVGGELLGVLAGDSDPDHSSLLDRLSISTGERLNAATGTEDYDAEFHLGGPWFLHGERDIYDAYNLGILWRHEFTEWSP